MGKIKTGIKMRVTPEQSKKIQEICFENGIEWVTGKHIRYLDEPFLFINRYNELGYTSKAYESYFNEDDREEVSAELFIKTNGTCVESETPTEDTNKGKQMEELKLECLVEGYEGTYFEVGQVWETRGGKRLTVKGFDFKTEIYKLTMSEDGDLTGEYYYTSKGEDEQGRESGLDLVKLVSTEIPTETTPTKSIPTEEPQPKTLSEYLKENNAYGSFVENCVEAFLKDIDDYFEIKRNSDGDSCISLGSAFNWHITKQGNKYWSDLYYNIPKNLVYDMNEIVFAEVDKRIAEQNSSTEPTPTEEFDQMLEQKAPTKYMVFVEGKSTPRYIHETKDSAETEAKRLSTKLVGSKVFVVEIIKEYKSKVIVEEL